MRLQKVDNQQTSFKMYFNIPEKVTTDFISELDRFVIENKSNNETMNKHVKYRANKALHLLQDFYRDVIEHNKTAKNHYVYDDIVTIEKFSCYPETINLDLDTICVKTDASHIHYGVLRDRPEFDIKKQNTATDIQKSLIFNKSFLENNPNEDLMKKDLAYLQQQLKTSIKE